MAVVERLGRQHNLAQLRVPFRISGPQCLYEISSSADRAGSRVQASLASLLVAA
jgi:hypothetical protein